MDNQHSKVIVHRATIPLTPSKITIVRIPNQPCRLRIPNESNGHFYPKDIWLPLIEAMSYPDI